LELVLAGALALVNAQETSYISNGDSYYLVPTLMTWADAEYNCVAVHQGHLASFHDQDTYNDVMTNLGSSNVDMTNGATAPWIGLNDKVTEGTYVWTDGTAAGFQNWRPGEPNDYAGEDCVQAMVSGLNDMSCTAQLASICLVPAPVPPAQSPTPLTSGGDPNDPADRDLGTFKGSISPGTEGMVDLALSGGQNGQNGMPVNNLVNSVLNGGMGTPAAASASTSSGSHGASALTTLFVIAGCLTFMVVAGKMATKARNTFRPITTLSKEENDEAALLNDPKRAAAAASYNSV
jgi:hypothetical protein